MLHKTRGIVLNYIKYSETSIIAKIYTENLGLQTYIINGVRSKSSKNKIALFQPLTLLDLVVYYKTNSHIQRISEVKLNRPFRSIHFENKKSSIALFLTELLSKTLKEEGPHPQLFEFIFSAFIWFDESDKDFENFHLQFLLKLSSYLGFEPTETKDFTNVKELSTEVKDFLQSLMNVDFDVKIKTNNKVRREVLELLLKFYSEHIDNLGEFKSIRILKEIMQ